MSDYLDAPITFSSLDAQRTTGDTTANDNAYVMQTGVNDNLIKVDDTPYIRPDKIVVRRYRLYKTKETQ